MGLAASQSRLLLLTARKNDIEAQMMSISNQKLSLSRQSAELSDNYTKALNSTKLTWSSTGEDITYDLLMHPNTSVSAGQYMLTNTSTGAVILDSEYQSKLGLTGSGAASDFLSAYPTAAKFISKCMGVSAGALSGTSGSDVEKFSTSYSDADVFKTLYAMDNSSYTRNPATSNVVNFFTCSKYVGSGSTNLDASNMTLAMSALEDEVIATTGDTADAVIALLQDSFGSSWSSALETKITLAASAAQQDTLDFYDSQIASADSSADTSSSTNNDVIGATAGSNKVTNDAYGNDELYIDRTQMIKTFLAFFDAECAGIDGDDSTTKSKFRSEITPSSTSRPSTGGGTGSSCTVNNAGDTTSGDKNNNSLSDSYEEAYYANLYEALAESGWQVNSGMDTKDALQNQILYGNITLNQISFGSWQPVSSSDTGYPIQAEDDKDAINKAEAQYNADKDKLDYKESMLDVSMNDLDTERSAIETETTSVQKIIDKNIESSFKMFQNA